MGAATTSRSLVVVQCTIHSFEIRDDKFFRFVYFVRVPNPVAPRLPQLSKVYSSTLPSSLASRQAQPVTLTHASCRLAEIVCSFTFSLI